MNSIVSETSLIKLKKQWGEGRRLCRWRCWQKAFCLYTSAAHKRIQSTSSLWTVVPGETSIEFFQISLWHQLCLGSGLQVAGIPRWMRHNFSFPAIGRNNETKPESYRTCTKEIQTKWWAQEGMCIGRYKEGIELRFE